jgi:hypothetical protein
MKKIGAEMMSLYVSAIENVEIKIPVEQVLTV